MHLFPMRQLPPMGDDDIFVSTSIGHGLSNTPMRDMFVFCFLSLTDAPSSESSWVWSSGGGWCQDGSPDPWGAAEDERWQRVGWCLPLGQFIKLHSDSLFCYLFNYSRCLCAVKILENMQTAGEEMRDKMSRSAYYLSLLLKVARQKYIARKCK